MVDTKEFFVSYPHEDVKIATALAATLQQIDDTFVTVHFDRISLESGLPFRAQLEDKLQRSEVLFVVHTDVTKPAFGYTGWEVGYFEGVHRDDPGSLIISLYLNTPPASVADRQGIGLNITTEDLRRETETFQARIATEVTANHPLVRFMDEKRLELAVARKDAELGASRHVDTGQSVRDMIVSIFQDLKQGPDTTIKPQKQITLTTHRNSLEATDGDLPSDTTLIPRGSGAPMGVFGLPEQPISWVEFCGLAARHALGRTWVEAIRAVIASSSPNQINVDNSQIVLAPDNHIYRLILSTSTTYFNGRIELSLYLVEALRRPDHGDQSTTNLLKGLELASRFRFLFLETNSRFYWNTLKLLSIDQLRVAARDLVTELNLLQRDARDAGLHEPAVWGGLVEWKLLEKISEEWRPRHEQLRALCAALMSAKASDDVDGMRRDLVRTVLDLENGIRPYNTQLIIQMAGRLQDVVRDTDKNISAGLQI